MLSRYSEDLQLKGLSDRNILGVKDGRVMFQMFKLGISKNKKQSLQSKKKTA